MKLGQNVNYLKVTKIDKIYYFKLFKCNKNYITYIIFLCKNFVHF